MILLLILIATHAFGQSMLMFIFCSYVNMFTIVCAKAKTKDVGMVVSNKCSM